MGKDENIANKLRELRKQMGLSQVKMAQLLGVKTRTYRAYEQAQNDISLDTLNILDELQNAVENADFETKRKVVKSLVKEIVVYPNEIKITFFFNL